MAPTRSGIFKHLKFSENDKFTGTNSVDSILDHVVRRSPSVRRVPGSIPGVVNETLSKITKILFLIEDTSELEC